MNRTDRLYAIAEDLRAAGASGRTADALARRFEVSLRTVKRDVSALQQAGVPVTARPGPGGGYLMAERASMPPVGFTPAEAVAVALALQRSSALPFGSDGRSALTKLIRSMSPGERDRVDDLAGRLWVRDDVGGALRGKVATTLDEAVRRRVVTRLTYVGSDAATSVRDVEPAALALTKGHWYLLAWCRLRRAPRWFRLDRIRAAHLTREASPEHDPATEFGTPPPDAAPVPL